MNGLPHEVCKMLSDFDERGKTNREIKIKIKLFSVRFGFVTISEM